MDTPRSAGPREGIATQPDVRVDAASLARGICSYDLGRFPAGIVVDRLRTHLSAVAGGQLHHNAFSASPAVLREELRGRREHRPS